MKSSIIFQTDFLQILRALVSLMRETSCFTGTIVWCFYDKLSTSHQYIRLGYIEEVERFTQAIGEGDVTVALDLAGNDE